MLGIFNFVNCATILDQLRTMCPNKEVICFSLNIANHRDVVVVFGSGILKTKLSRDF